MLTKHFLVLSYNSSSPILHPTSLDMLEHNGTTQLVIVNRNGGANITKLKELFPELDLLLKSQNDSSFISTFYDRAHRPIIIIKADTQASLNEALAKLEKQQYLETNPSYYPLN